MKNSNKTNSIILLLVLPVLAITLTVTSCENQQDIEVKGVQTFQQQTEARKKAGVVMDPRELSKQTEFVGGMDKLYAYLGANMTYPESAKADSIEGRVYVNFLINENGEIKETQVLRGVNDALDSEALRVISTMPDWTPAEKDGIPVTVEFTLPIMFKLK